MHINYNKILKIRIYSYFTKREKIDNWKIDIELKLKWLLSNTKRLGSLEPR